MVEVEMKPNLSPVDDITKVEVKIDEITKPEVKKEDFTKTASFQELFESCDNIDIACMAVGCLGSMITGASMPVFIALMGDLLNGLNEPDANFSDVIDQKCIEFVIIAAFNVCSGFMQVCGWSIAGERLSKRYKERYVHAILSQEVGWFDTCGAGELSTKVSDLGGKLQDGLTRKLSDLVQYVLQFMTAFATALYLCWQLAVVLLASFPLIAVSGYFMIQAVSAAQNETSGQYAKAGGLATEMLSSIRTVTALNDQPGAIAKYRKFILDAMEVGLLKAFKVGLGNGITFGVSYGTYALGFWYGAKLIADQMDNNCTHNCLTGGDIVVVFFCAIIAASSLGQIVPPLNAFVSAKAAAATMLEVINRKPLIDGLSSEGKQPAERSAGKISLRNIEFAYPSRPNLQICKGYGLEIEPGQTVALCGPSGAGKSTIINLLLRFYDPQNGSVELDGTDVRDLNIRWLRSQIGYVGQEPILFSGSIAENIAYGIDREVEKDLTDEQLRERVHEAARQANAHEFILGFPKGYETDVGGSGSSLSGGQKQRIAIARALIKKPSVLLLDEATSALDAASEKTVQKSIDALSKGHAQTTIIIAHRLSTIRNADKIAVVNNGVVAELGTHDELVAKKGMYYDLVNLQMLGHEDDDGEDDGLVKAAQKEAQSLAGGATHLNPHETHDVPGRKRTISGAQINADHKPSTALESQGPVNASAKLDSSAKKAIIANIMKENPDIKKKIWAMVMPNLHWLLVGLLGAAMVGGSFPIWGLLLGDAEAMFFNTTAHTLREKSKTIAGRFCMLGIDCILGYTMQYYGIAKVGQFISSNLRSSMFESLLRRDVGYFDFEENGVGALTTRLAEDARLVHEATGETLSNQFQAFFTLAVGIVIAFTASWKISLVVLATFPLTIAGAMIRMAARNGQNSDTTGLESGGDQGAQISAAFVHMRTVSAFSIQHKISKQYADAMQVISEERQKRSIYFGAGLGFSNSTMFLNNALLFWYGSTLIMHDGLSFRDLMVAQLALLLGALGLGQALNEMGDQKEGLEAAVRIFKMVDDGAKSPIDGLSTTGKKPTERPAGRIELQGVKFAYPTRPDVQVCENYNLIIEPGEVVALVGPSGSGKSTIMNLLLRFYNPLEGRVLFDGEDIKDLNVRWLRSQIGYVGQEPVLFAGSVAENVGKGRADGLDFHLMTLMEASQLSKQEATQARVAAKTALTATKTGGAYSGVAVADVETGATATVEEVPVPDDVVSACIASNAHDFIKTFPQGYETDVGEGSIMVSGGQKQRIAIARALIKKPAVLLLDEATSALDAASELLVQQSIDELQKSHAQTTIIIAHRLSTIRNADKIAVIDHGSVVELGSHDELLAKKGLYHELWNKQLGNAH